MLRAGADQVHAHSLENMPQFEKILWKTGIFTMETAEILDEYARNLLAELAVNARASYADLGRRVGLSPSAVIVFLN